MASEVISAIRFLRPNEAAEYCGVTRGRIIDAARYRELTILKLSDSTRMWRFGREELDRWKAIPEESRRRATHVLEYFMDKHDIIESVRYETGGLEVKSVVYFVQATDRKGPIKIGVSSTSLEDRIKGLQTGCPYPIKPLGSIPGGPAAERSLHRMFESYRMQGEWFRPARRLRLFIYDLICFHNPRPEDAPLTLDEMKMAGIY